MDGPIRQNQLTFEELRIVGQNLKPNIVVMPLLAALIGMMFWQWAPHTLVALWWSLVFVAAFPLHLVSQRFGKSEEIDCPLQIRRQDFLICLVGLNR